MKIFLFVFCLLTTAVLSVEKSELFFSNGVLGTGLAGMGRSLVKNLLLLAEPQYTTANNVDSFNSLATTYYGKATFGILLARGNNQVRLTQTNALTSILPTNIKLRFPSPFFCTQFMSVDCVLDSFKASSLLPSGNYWRNLKTISPDLYNNVANMMVYPKYTIFVMSYLMNDQINPKPTLKLEIINNMDSTLVEGKIDFVTGFSEAPPKEIPSNSISEFYASQKNLLEGIHGTLSYKMKSFFGGVQQDVKIHFHVYAGNGTFLNTLKINDMDALTQGTYSALSLGSEVKLWASISKSPKAEIKIIFSPTQNGPALSKQPQRIRPESSTQVVSGSFSEGTNNYSFGLSDNTYYKLGQGWRLVSLNLGVEYENQFRIINANSSLAVTANVAAARFEFAEPHAERIHQIWQTIPVPNKPKMFFIKSATSNLCWHYNLSTYLNPYADQLHDEIWLENCDTNQVMQKWLIEDLPSTLPTSPGPKDTYYIQSTHPNFQGMYLKLGAKAGDAYDIVLDNFISPLTPPSIIEFLSVYDSKINFSTWFDSLERI